LRKFPVFTRDSTTCFAMNIKSGGAVILDASGSSIIKTQSKNKIDVSALNGGAYFLRMNSTDNFSLQKIIIQK